ncbi:sulfite exporter TauE/SafE family protein [Aestuariivirga sp.]|uniref:sulfite exporter TauE/SafE family protein n=1 Tax=Aestuariivirga sp. TaxID=2650926 RepID=UPI0039E669CA
MIFDITWNIALLLFGAGILGGVINAVAGGATLFTFPAMMAAGLSPIAANASSSVALTPGNLSGVLSEKSQLPAFDATMWLHIAVAAVGGGIGAVLLLWTPDKVFTALVPLLIGVATLIFAFSKQIQAALRPADQAHHDTPVARQVALAPTAIYGGYFGAGMGVMFMAAFSMTSPWAVRTANAVKNLLGAAVNWTAIIIFVVQGVIAWPQTLIMLVGATIGGFLGGKLLGIVPVIWIRRFVIAMGALMTLIYAYRYWL